MPADQGEMRKVANVLLRWRGGGGVRHGVGKMERIAWLVVAHQVGEDSPLEDGDEQFVWEVGDVGGLFVGIGEMRLALESESGCSTQAPPAPGHRLSARSG